MRPSANTFASNTGLRQATSAAVLFAAVLSSLLLLVQPARAAESPPRGLNLSNYKIYTVRQDTTVTAPSTGPRCTDVRVWHALPTYRPWCQMQSPYGALDYHTQPKAMIEPEDDRRSTHILFDSKTGQAPNVEMHYITEFRVVSPDRKFDPSFLHLDWHDIQDYNAENKITFPSPNREVADLAEKLKNNKGPIDTIVEFSKWMKENLTYDATSNIDGSDLTSILSRRRGHCYHYTTLFRALCGATGLQVRSDEGLNLFFPNGSSTVEQARVDYTNAHVWPEVFIPTVGWIEVEPNGGEKCFTIPSSYVQNNTKFQNYAVWITEQGHAPRVPRWSYQGSKYVNEYGIAHKITFSEVKR